MHRQPAAARTAQVPNFSAAAIKRQMRKALLLTTTATAIRPTTRRAALGAITTVPTAAVGYDSKNYDTYASSYDDLDGGQAAKALGIAAAAGTSRRGARAAARGRRGDGPPSALLRRQ